ncbi:MAG TPA: squalene/phytoene synthase family protein [Dokdonella sp.]|uniref:squalene/phytoene synthase family protein n=1 Tax=Dokdonella sp. TaxID=2291710 RepID=UPI002BD3BE35|nr:squalene/phytoene synthase family protein [Dokdonella sp.]HUD42124.1 squalene/phytoene synthase family protein [Dokdonella sp.]
MAGEEGLGSFEAKWSGVHPELALALRFVPGRARDHALGLAVVGLEIEDAAFRIAEDHVAEAKLHWWAEELARLLDGKPRHPATQALNCAAGPAVPPGVWDAVIAGALAIREARPAGTLADLIEDHRRYYGPFARAAAAASPGVSVEAAAEAAVLGRALQDLADLRGALGRGRLPLPLDLLARHQIDRGELTARSPARDEGLRELSRQIAARLHALPWQALPLLAGIRQIADLGRAERAAGAADPAAALVAARGRLGPSAAWRAWRLARRGAI